MKNYIRVTCIPYQPMEILHQLRDAFSSKEPSQQVEENSSKFGDVFECRECGTTFISNPTQCSKCDNDEFRNHGSC